MTLPILSAAFENSNELAFDDGEHQIRYGDIEAVMTRSKVSRINEILSDTHVAWCPANDLESFVEFWAILCGGCVACPVSHRFPESARNEIVQRIDAKWLPDLQETANTSRSHNHFDIEKPATLILSSGSTGTPKAVVHSMAAHIASAEGAAENMPLDSGDRWLWSLPLCHVSGLSILVRCAVAGATVVGVPHGKKLSAELLAQQKITHLSVVSAQLRQLVHENGFPSEHLKAVLLGGSSVDPSLVDMARERGVPVHTTYGLTEMASQVTTSAITDDPATSGSVLRGRSIRIDSSGEIFVRGETLCLGYFRSGDIHPVVDEVGWFHTRDMGELDDQHRLLVKGRMDNMFISGGENIHPEAIERAMLSMFNVEQVVVVPRADTKFGSRPVAFVKGELPRDWNELLREKLQGYEIPVQILAWPAEADGAIKPGRQMLIKLSKRGM